jgi:UDP-N-acetylmuramoyl-tripeptide--D-alanyl-D-alanine ligase
MRLSEIAELLNSELIGEDREIKGFSTDSRKINEGELFIALKGEKFNGEDFTEEALSKGAVGCIVSESFNKNLRQIIRVKNPLNALIGLAKYYRDKYLNETNIIAIGGAVGKTTTKEMLFKVFSNFYKTYKSPKSYNNHIGVPLTILNTPKEAQFLILEIGTNHIGEVEFLVDIAKPRYAILTNIEVEHIEFFKSIENIAIEESNIFKSADVGFIRKEDYLKFSNIIKKPPKIITFDINDYKYEFLEIGVRLFLNDDYVDFINYGWLENAVCVLKVCEFFNIKEPYKFLKNFKSESMRMEILKINDFEIINDAYNSNPASFKALLYSIKPSKKNLFIIGDMLELGEFSEFYHRQIGKYILELKHDNFIFVGNFVRWTYDELKGKINCYYFDSKEKAFEFLKNYSKTFKRIILKASRGMKFEDFIENVKDWSS